MTVVMRFLAFVRRLLSGRRAELELDESVRNYVDLLAEENVRGGMDPTAARRAAFVAVGSVEHVKEEVRAVRAGNSLEVLAQDVRYGARTLARAPVFTIVAVTALALGVGANATIFSVVNAVLLKPLPYHDAGRLVTVLHQERAPVAPGNFLDWRRESRTLDMGAAEYWTPTLAGSDNAERVVGLRVTADLFPLLGVRPLLGRGLLSEQDGETGERLVVISYGLWQRQFGGDSAVVGRSVLLSGSPHTIAGVMPSSFVFAPFWATGAELWVPIDLSARASARTSNSLRVFGRLRQGVTLEQARAEIASLTARLEEAYPGTNRGVEVTPLHDVVVGNVRGALWMLLGAVTFVLLIACANVVHMMLARAAAREREFALRNALGASRLRLTRQLLTESALLGALSGAVGLAVAAGGIRLVSVLRPVSLPGVTEVALDGSVLVFLLVVSTVAGLVCGLLPALRSAKADLIGSLKEGGRSGIGRHRMPHVLVVAEFALALVLTAGAGLMARSFVAIRQSDAGLDPANVVSMVVSTAGAPQEAPHLRHNFFNELVMAAAALPGVNMASAVNHLPIVGDLWGTGVVVEGRPRPAPGEGPSAIFRVVMPGYFETMGIRRISGRDFSVADDSGAVPVVVVNRRLTEVIWPGEEPLGKRLRLTMGGDSAWREVVGVINDVVQDDWTAPRQPEVYVPYEQALVLREVGGHANYLTIVARTEGEPAAIVPALRRLVRDRGSLLSVSEVQTMREVAASSMGGSRFYLIVLGVFAVLALMLAAVGIYGVMSHAVARRTHEIGVRLALGARRSAVLGEIVMRGMKLAGLGSAIGLVGALLVIRLMTSFLYGVEAGDPVTLFATAMLLTLVALVACIVPAVRATRIDPVTAFRRG